MPDDRYECSCHRQMGNDFWFLPTGRCLNTPEVCDGPKGEPAKQAREVARREYTDAPRDGLKSPRTNAFRAWLATEHPTIFDEFFTLNGAFNPRRSWAAYMRRVKYRRIFSEAREARVREALYLSFLVGC